MTNQELADKFREILRIVSSFNSMPLTKEQATQLRKLDVEIAAECRSRRMSPPNFTPLPAENVNAIGFCRIPCDQFQPIVMSRTQEKASVSTDANERKAGQRVLVVREVPRWVESVHKMIEMLQA